VSKTHHIIYVPGLGDRHPGHIQINLLINGASRAWSRTTFAVGWSNSEPFDSKLNRLIGLIDELSTKNSLVSLLGTSAGAGLVLNAYLARPKNISRVVYVCGELTGFAKINPRYFKENPAFKDSMAMATPTWAN